MARADDAGAATVRRAHDRRAADRPRSARRRLGVRRTDAPGPGLLGQVGPWLGYAGCFVGAGLVSGGIVHHPLDPSRYTVLAAVGVLAFLVATLAAELAGSGPRPGRGALLRVAGGSLLLALGIEMLPGGIQHFSDVPDRAVVPVPAGLLLSWLAFQLRGGAGLRGLALSRATGGVAVLALGLFLGLPFLASAAPAGGHAHGPVAAVPAAQAEAHADPAHADTADADAAHADAAHGDPAHRDPAHAPGAGHTDPAHDAPETSGGSAAADLEDVMAELVARMADLAAQ